MVHNMIGHFFDNNIVSIPWTTNNHSLHTGKDRVFFLFYPFLLFYLDYDISLRLSFSRNVISEFNAMIKILENQASNLSRFTINVFSMSHTIVSSVHFFIAGLSSSEVFQIPDFETCR